MKMKESTFLLWLLIALAIVFIILFASSRASAMPIWNTNATNELIGSRNLGNGIAATGGWTEGFELKWNITKDNNTHLWTYNYTVAMLPTVEGHIKELSHLIIEVTEGQDFSWTEASPGLDSDSPKEYICSYTVPLSSLYGIKFEYESSGIEEAGWWLYESSITTPHAPVYGVFAAKNGVYDGTETCAWSTALEGNYKSGTNQVDFIVRPNGITTCPEPATCFLVGVGMLGLIGRYKNV